MSEFENQIWQITQDRGKTINSSIEEIEKFKKQCNEQIKQIVDKVKSDIMIAAQRGSINYAEKSKYTLLTNKIKKIKTMPHYLSSIEIYYCVNIRESVCEYKSMSYRDYDCDKTVLGFEVNAYKIIVYIVEQVINSLIDDNIYPIYVYCNRDGDIITKYNCRSYKGTEEFQKIRKNFKLAKQERNIRKPVFEHRMQFAFFL